MSQQTYQTKKKEFARMNRLYPDQGRSFRPWEAPLRQELQRLLNEGIQAGHAWAIKEQGRQGHWWPPY